MSDFVPSAKSAVPRKTDSRWSMFWPGGKKGGIDRCVDKSQTLPPSASPPLFPISLSPFPLTVVDVDVVVLRRAPVVQIVFALRRAVDARPRLARRPRRRGLRAKRGGRGRRGGGGGRRIGGARRGRERAARHAGVRAAAGGAHWRGASRRVTGGGACDRTAGVVSTGNAQNTDAGGERVSTIVRHNLFASRPLLFCHRRLPRQPLCCPPSPATATAPCPACTATGCESRARRGWRPRGGAPLRLECGGPPAPAPPLNDGRCNSLS